MTGAIVFSCTLLSTTILFVGNSYTMSGGGIWNQVKAIYESVMPDTLTALAHTAGGATFEDHWNDPDLRELLETAEMDIVVFQEQSCMPVTDPSLMYMYGDSLAMLCISKGIQPAFFMTWSRRNDPMMLEGLCLGYSRMGFIHSCTVAPCGIAFEVLRKSHQEIDPWDADGAHPSPQGSYLASCVISSAILDIDLQEAGIWQPEGISGQEGEILRLTAVSACSSYVQPWNGEAR